MSAARKASDLPLPGGSFRLFVTRLGYQTLMALGLVENPLTGAQQVDLHHARMLIDDLEMLQAKTEGNLDPEERGHIDKLVRDLEQAFVRVEAEG